MNEHWSKSEGYYLVMCDADAMYLVDWYYSIEEGTASIFRVEAWSLVSFPFLQTFSWTTLSLPVELHAARPHHYSYCKYVCTYIHKHICTYINTYIHTYIHTYVCTYVCTSVHPSIHPSSCLSPWRWQVQCTLKFWNTFSTQNGYMELQTSTSNLAQQCTV